MKGARAEPSVNTITRLRKTRTTMMGPSHHFFLVRMEPHSSEKIESREEAFLRNFMSGGFPPHDTEIGVQIQEARSIGLQEGRQLGLPMLRPHLFLVDEERPHGKIIHFCRHEAPERILGRADDRLSADVEGGVDEHGASRVLFELADEVVEELVVLAPDGLEPRRSVDVGDGRDFRAHLIPHLRREEHVRARPVELEILCHLLFEDHRRERAEAFTKFYLQVHSLPVLRIPCVGEDASAAERAGAELHPPLEPSYHVLPGEDTAHPANEPRAIQPLVFYSLEVEKPPDLLLAE